MPYKLNGVELPTPPTTGQWIPKDIFGFAGDGRAMYPGVRQFEMRWQLLDPSGTSQLQSAYLAGTTGVAIADLPKYADSVYGFYSYTGVSIHEPELGEYFNGYYQDVLLIISNVRS